MNTTRDVDNLKIQYQCIYVITADIILLYNGIYAKDSYSFNFIEHHSIDISDIAPQMLTDLFFSI